MIVGQCSSHLKRDLGTGKRTHDTTAPISIDVARVKARVEVESRGTEFDNVL